MVNSILRNEISPLSNQLNASTAFNVWKIVDHAYIILTAKLYYYRTLASNGTACNFMRASTTVVGKRYGCIMKTIIPVVLRLMMACLTRLENVLKGKPYQNHHTGFVRRHSTHTNFKMNLTKQSFRFVIIFL